MNEIIIPDFIASSGAAAFVGTIEKDSVFQQSNHGGELVSVQLNETNKTVPLVDERGRPVIAKCSISFSELTQELRRQKWKTYVIVDNDKNVFVRFLSRPKVAEIVFVEELGVHGQSKINFFGEDYSFSTSRESHLYSVSKPCVTAKVHHSALGREVDLYIPFDTEEAAKDACEHLDKAELVFVSGMRIPTRFWNPKTRVRMAGMIFVAGSYWTKNDDYEDVGKIVPLVSSYDDLSLMKDLSSGEPLYPLYVNVLLWWNVFYVRIGDPVFNLILAGEPGVAKSHCLSLYARVFSDGGAMLGEGGTMKGLIPSFSGDEPKVGALADAKFFVVVDEFFKSPSSSAAKAGISKESNSYNAYLRDMLPVISRIEKVYASAKDTKFSVLMRASLLGSDNIKMEARRALETLLRDDPAVLRRFVVVYLDKGVWTRVKASQPANDDENIEFLNDYLSKRGLSMKLLKRFATYLRSVTPKIKCDSSRVVECVKKVFVTEAVSYFHKETLPDEKFMHLAASLCLKIDFIPHFQAMVRCSCVMRTIFGKNTEGLPASFKVEDADYVFAEDMFAQILRSEFFLFEEALSQLLEQGGIMRSA